MKKEFYYSKGGRRLSPGSNQNRWLWIRTIEDLMEGNFDIIESVIPFSANNYFCKNYHKYWNVIRYRGLIRFNRKDCGKCPIFKGLGISCTKYPLYMSIGERLETKIPAVMESCISDIMALILWMEEF